MSQPLNVIIVEKVGTLKSLAIKDFKFEDLFKKCGFKKGDDFLKQAEWNAKFDGKKYYIEVYGKTDGRPGSENKYDFPPPIDSTLLFGSCAIIAYYKTEDGKKAFIDLTLPLWNKIYEKLFGGFEDLTSNSAEDENEEDELDSIPKSKKTKQGYLKDGFVVDSSDGDDASSSKDDEEDYEDDDNEDECEDDDEDDSDNLAIEDVGSELSEEEYDYNDKDVSK
jgi:hypothetical protein